MSIEITLLSLKTLHTVLILRLYALITFQPVTLRFVDSSLKSIHVYHEPATYQF